MPVPVTVSFFPELSTILIVRATSDAIASSNRAAVEIAARQRAGPSTISPYVPGGAACAGVAAAGNRLLCPGVLEHVHGALVDGQQLRSTLWTNELCTAA